MSSVTESFAAGGDGGVQLDEPPLDPEELDDPAHPSEPASPPSTPIDPLDTMDDLEVWLTVSGCPLRDTITRDVQAAVGKLAGVSSVRVELDVMSEEQRRELQGKLRSGRPEREIPSPVPPR